MEVEFKVEVAEVAADRRSVTIFMITLNPLSLSTFLSSSVRSSTSSVFLLIDRIVLGGSLLPSNPNDGLVLVAKGDTSVDPLGL